MPRRAGPRRGSVESYHYVNRLFERSNRRSRTLGLTPYARSFGNCALEMFYGLLKARREGKHVAFLPPLHVRGFPTRASNEALFDLVADDMASLPRVRRVVWRSVLAAVFAILRLWYPIRRRLYQAIRRSPYVNPFYIVASVGWFGLWKPEAVHEFSWEEVERLDWARQYTAALHVRLRPDKKRAAEAVREQLGLPLDAWYVCLHVREGGFRRDWADDSYRNCSIENYLPAMRAVTDAGGYVVRLGDASMVPLPRMAGVIDCAHSPLRSKLMDVYLIGGCRFFVGTASGPIEVAWLFQRDTIATNLTEWMTCLPHEPGGLAILKHAFSRDEGRFLSVREILARPELQFWPDDAFQWSENSPEEIRDVVSEFMASAECRSAAHTRLQTEFMAARRLEMRRWLPEGARVFPGGRAEQICEAYRYASALPFEGTLGARFLEDNWARSSRDARARRGDAPQPSDDRRQQDALA